MTKPQKPIQSAISSFYEEFMRLAEDIAEPCADAEMNRRLNAYADTAVRIAQLPAVSGRDLRLTASALSRRLRENLSVDYQGEVIDYLLAESIRADLERLEEAIWQGMLTRLIRAPSSRSG
jgi:hypothetical protein